MWRLAAEYDAEVEHVVGIVVDGAFGDRLDALAERLPVWIADSEVNRAAAARVRAARAGAGTSHTAVGAVTTFAVAAGGTGEDWCIEVLGDVVGHHDESSHTPGLSAVEVYGTRATPALRAELAAYGLSEVTEVAGGFRAGTVDGRPAGLLDDG